ncbi:cutinase [Mycolicibacterium setense]|uniref:Cutinase n=2 Tax=Mycolicibacterium setense TaxID=431269 RepID=A0ABR4YRZ3_9MYCO|nr:cutinase family protein [Mycolicibacterium setense]KHO19108.1 cutinase [Mycolicibacterium setense]KHO23790.1 cutinase [Mycolicibacterium setense]MCV7113000.1 cutinase family protein [Mycolicibacterium setense]OBB13501.1 cutinase [Mycolicibacterium setense]
MRQPQRAPRGASITKVTQSVLFTVLALAAMVLGSLAGPLASANAADGCADVEVVFARGTNEAPGVGATGQAFVDALTADLPGKTIDVYGVNYPASLNFGQAADGIADASNRIQSIAANCPATKIVLGGYSQGAAVAGYTTSSAVPAGYVLPAGISGPMPASIASHVAAVALFGTPDEWVLGLADRSAPPIAIGQPYVAKTIQLCAPGDPICSPGGLSRAAHSSYKDNGMAIQAADFAARQLGGAAPSAPVVQTAGEVSQN